MQNNEAKSLILSMIDSIEPDKNLSKLISLLHSLSEDTLKDILELLKKVLFSDSRSNLQKLQAVRALRSLMQSQIPNIISFTHKKIIKKVPELIIFQSECKGFDLWLSALQDSDNSAFKIIIIMLQCIENWGEIYAKDARGKETKYSTVYRSLKLKDIEFPPSFFLKSCDFNEKNVTKRDLHRVRKLCKEFVKSINNDCKEKTLGLKKILNSYKKVLEKEISEQMGMSQKNKELIEFVLNQIEEARKMFTKWKSAGFVPLSARNEVKFVELVEDPFPKVLPMNDSFSDFDSGVDFQDFFLDCEKICNEHGFCPSHCKESGELVKVKEELVDSKELLNTYKIDLKNMQEKYIILLDDKEIFEAKAKELGQNIQELEKCLKKTKSMLYTISSENSSLVKENEALKYQNSVYKINIDQMDKMNRESEEEINKLKKTLEHIENGNVLLLYSNQTLKFELEKTKTNELALIEIIKDLKKKNSIDFTNKIPSFIYIKPKNLGTQPFYTMSDSESERPSICDEEIKQIPNTTYKLGRRSKSRTERTFLNIPTNPDIEKIDLINGE
ncbi:hypothetical protein SteCoe_17098 [Stentor coeruleus]|uniref:VHS domain-containing protein n=1 Tax=Stentor coeruleus TaxID=5963 RepID=A0A1R2BZQ5_9CILI|nr:hypothetical protein SteCoe_17098 [Stentor coeruleus]